MEIGGLLQYYMLNKFHRAVASPSENTAILSFIHNVHILASHNFNQHHSAYRPGHSTETALVQL